VYLEAIHFTRDSGPTASFSQEKELVMSAPILNRFSPAHVSQLRDLDSARHACVHELLEASVQERAQSIAVEFEGRSLTYAELHARANQLARVLRKHGVKWLNSSSARVSRPRWLYSSPLSCVFIAKYLHR
jgi:non-ribosomal peptide synthetase component F